MSYIGLSDFEREFNNQELARLSGDPSGIIVNTVRIGLVADMATSEVDSNLTGLYALPFTEVPLIISHIAYELGVYYLYSFYYKNSEIPDQIRFRRYNAVTILKLISKGDIKLGVGLQINRIISRNSIGTNEFELIPLKDKYF